VTLSSTVRHFRLVRELAAGTWAPGRISKDAIVLALILALMGLLMAGYLIFVR
jgi:putative membrane protein